MPSSASVGFLVAYFFGPLSQALGADVVFWSFGGAAAAAGVFCLLAVPETKGKSLEEIQKMFRTEM